MPCVRKIAGCCAARRRRCAGSRCRALVLHDHDQRRDDVERRDRHDQQQDEEQRRLRQLDRAEEVRVLAAPVVDVDSRRPSDARARAPLRRGEQVGELQAQAASRRRPCDTDARHRQYARSEIAIELVHAGREQADDLERAMRGITPAGVDGAQRVTMTTRSPSRHRAPSPAPRRARCRTRPASAPRTSRAILSAIAVTLRSSSGNTPVTIAPLSCAAPISNAWSSMNGAAPSTSGSRAIRAAASCQSPSREPNALMVACEVRLRMRSRTSRSKPFITDSTTISTATPIAIPPSR